jgi:hypothetical protein
MSSITTTGVRPSAPGADHSVWYAGRVFTVLVTSAETDGRYTVVEETMQRGTSLDLPLRIHNTETVCAFVVDGEETSSWAMKREASLSAVASPSLQEFPTGSYSLPTAHA